MPFQPGNTYGVEAGKPFRFKPGHDSTLKHGHARAGKESRTYRSWRHALERCNSENDIHFHLYGGRGIKVCERWFKFENFLEDMGNCPQGLSLDRIDVDGNYELENCRWATQQEQANNRRDNHYIEFNGRNQTIAEWGRELGLEGYLIEQRLNKLGWSVEKTLMTPKNKCGRHYLEFNGKNQTIAEWGRELNLKPSIISKRLNNLGWSVEKALTTPVRRLSK